jgi:two-component system phosphate regulon sensor histidine kinase PhoR
MKKKILGSMLASVIFSLIIITTLVIVVANYEYIENVKQEMTTNNELLINILKSDEIKNKQLFFNNYIKSQEIRMTFIDKDGKVLGDSIADAETMENHNNRPEVIDARKYGTGFSIRLSKTTSKETLYFATAFGDGLIIRSAVPMKIINGFELTYIKYYILVMIAVLLVTFLISSRLANAIVKPIKELEFITSKIANGEFNKRVTVSSKDEMGELSNTFNFMADKLENSFKDSMEKQTKLEAILKSMDSGVIAVDKNYKVMIINPYAENIFGIKKNIIGEKLLNNIRDFEFEDILKNKENNKEITIFWPEKRELRIKTADIINGEEQIGIVAVIHDVTDIKRLENIRSQFVTNVSHELKTPLTSIKGFAETLKYVEDKETRNKFLGIIDDESDRLTRLIDDILTLSQIENAKVIKKDEININEVINHVIMLVKNSADKKRINISCQGEKLPYIYGDRDKFKQMLLNLADNAIKYSGEDAEVVIGTELKEGNCVISVKDNGPGISKEHIDRLFERFYRVDKARSREQGGTGLGLAIVKHIVLNFNGTIQVESNLGKGSKFIVEIPVNNS